MPRRNLIRSSSHPYHVTGRGNNKQSFPCSMEEAWMVFCSNLKEIDSLYGAKIHAFVLMPNHFHMLISTPKEDLGIVMQKFMASTTRTINHITGRSGRIFGARYHWSLIHDLSYFDTAIKYVYRNPVRAKLISRAEDYRFSTLNGVLGYRKLKFPVQSLDGYPLIPNNNLKDYLEWMNQSSKTEHDEVIGKGLKKPIFHPRIGWRKKLLFKG